MHHSYRWWYNSVHFSVSITCMVLGANFILIHQLESLNIVHLKRFLTRIITGFINVFLLSCCSLYTSDIISYRSKSQKICLFCLVSVLVLYLRVVLWKLLRVSVKGVLLWWKTLMYHKPGGFFNSNSANCSNSCWFKFRMPKIEPGQKFLLFSFVFPDLENWFKIAFFCEKLCVSLWINCVFINRSFSVKNCSWTNI